jgi:cytochrome c
VWTDELVVKYLEDPNAFLKGFLTEKGKEDQISGVTKMVFKLADETERRNVVAYLKTFSK